VIAGKGKEGKEGERRQGGGRRGGCRVEGSGGKLRRWRGTEEGSIGRG